MNFLVAFILIASFTSATQSDPIKTIFVGHYPTKESIPGAKLYSTKTLKCYSTNVEGKLTFPLIQGDSVQIEQTGYALLRYTHAEILKLDSVFLKKIGEVELGTTGMIPILDIDTYRNYCRCCR
jgi:hypothetical protein